MERLLKKGYEVLYLTEAVDEYAISALPEFDGKKFQNVAKEGFSIDGDTEAAKARKAELSERWEFFFVFSWILLQGCIFSRKITDNMFLPQTENNLNKTFDNIVKCIIFPKDNTLYR